MSIGEPFATDAVVLASGEDHGTRWELVVSGDHVFLRLPHLGQAVGPWGAEPGARLATFRERTSTWRCWWGRLPGEGSVRLQGRPERLGIRRGEWFALPLQDGEESLGLVMGLESGRTLLTPAPPVVDDTDAVVLAEGVWLDRPWVLRVWPGPTGGTVAEVCRTGFEGLGDAVELPVAHEAALDVALVGDDVALGTARLGLAVEVDGAETLSFALGDGARAVWLAFGARRGATVVARGADGYEEARATVG